MSLVPPAGVAKADGARARVLIEHLRAQVRALEQVPVSLANPPRTGRGPSPPRLLFFSLPRHCRARPGNPPQERPSSLAATGMDARIAGSPASGHDESHPPFEQARKAAGCMRSGLKATAMSPAALGFALAVIAQQAAAQNAPRDLVLWCLTSQTAREWGRPYGPGLIAYGLDPALFLLVKAQE